MTTLGPTYTPTIFGGADVGGIAVGRIGPIPENGTLNSIYVYINAANASYARTIGVLYADASGTPGALIAQTAPFISAPDNTPAWKNSNTITNPSLTSGSYYWVGLQTEHDSMSVYSEFNTADLAELTSGTFGTLPDPFGTPDQTRNDLQLAAYIDYTASSSGVSIYVGTSPATSSSSLSARG